MARCRSKTSHWLEKEVDPKPNSFNIPPKNKKKRNIIHCSCPVCRRIKDDCKKIRSKPKRIKMEQYPDPISSVGPSGITPRSNRLTLNFLQETKSSCVCCPSKFERLFTIVIDVPEGGTVRLLSK